MKEMLLITLVLLNDLERLLILRLAIGLIIDNYEYSILWHVFQFQQESRQLREDARIACSWYK
jgi:hypothetical protein